MILQRYIYVIFFSFSSKNDKYNPEGFPGTILVSPDTKGPLKLLGIQEKLKHGIIYIWYTLLEQKKGES